MPPVLDAHSQRFATRPLDQAESYTYGSRKQGQYESFWGKWFRRPGQTDIGRMV